jgi:tRNA G10  N-methylase Trm11
VTRMFAAAIAGLSPILRQVLTEVPGVTVHDFGFDGRSDLVLFDVDQAARAEVMELGMTEDVFVEVGRTLRADGDKPGWIAGRIWRPARVERALSVWAAEVKPLKATMTFRVIVRVLQERSFQRTELRRQLTQAIQRERPKWRLADPAELEVWTSEYARGRFVAGLRLSSVRMRQRDGRAVERPGALRPTVANALIHLAGEPNGLLLDPCCGSGTILNEALAVGWDVRGRDIDPEAVEASRQNVGKADVQAGDVRSLEMGDGSVDACVSNLPFGQQYSVQGSMTAWLRAALAEIARVTKRGGRVVILVPEIPRTIEPAELHLRMRFPIRLLGTKTTIWVFDRA